MQKLILVLMLLWGLPINQCSKNPYFERRKAELKNVKITLHPRPKGSKVDERYYAVQETYNHTHTRLINQPEFCSQHEKVFLLFAIRTIYSHIERRQVIREQFIHQQYVKYGEEIIIKHIFLFAKTKDPITEKLIKEESNRYNDIIQEDFVESYINVSLKAIMAWKWALEFCPNTEYVMVENDELYVDIDKMVSFLFKDLSMNRNDDHFAVCSMVGNTRSLHRNMKQFTELPSEILYKGDFYPPYCNGYGYVAHINVINKLYKASFSNPSFMPTDVWIGVMAEKLQLQIPRLNFVYTLENIQKYFSDPYYPVNDVMIAVTDFAKNKGNEATIMRYIITNMKRHWTRNDDIRQLWIPYKKPDDNYTKNIAYYSVIFLFAVILLKFLRRGFVRIFP